MAELKDGGGRILITLTAEEFETLKKVASFEGKPVATVFMRFVREARVFMVLKKVVKAADALIAAKSYFSSKYKKTAIG
ncbi:hypothetical protein K3U78_004509 [Salmonella enterica]|nr:hypothetical protein [Salmonella enterica]